MSPEREAEFIELAGYIHFYSTHVVGLDPSDPAHTSNTLNEIVQRHGRSRALVGLRQAINDTVEHLSNKPPEYVQQLDALLSELKLITASEVRRRYSSAYKRILKRGNIKTETEYYLVAGIVADCSADVQPAERSQLEQFISAYEREA